MLNRGARAKAEGSRLIAAARSEKRACLLEPEAKVLRALRDEPVPAEGVPGEKKGKVRTPCLFRYDRAIPDQSVSLAISLGLNSRSK